MDRITIELVVENHPGVLNRITGLYARRGYNIASIYANETINQEYSQILIVSSGDKYTQTQMVRQLRKLQDVDEVTLMTRENL